MSTPATNYLAGIPASPEWKQELNERLAAARARRTREKIEQAALPVLNRFAGHPNTRTAELAARVAARYAKAPSFSEMLTRTRQAEEDQRERSAVSAVLATPPVLAAPAAAAVSATADRAIDRSQTIQASEESGTLFSMKAIEDEPDIRSISTSSGQSTVSKPELVPDLFRLEPDMSREPGIRAMHMESGTAPASSADTEEPGPAAWEAEAPSEPTQPLPVNLIEFPRELVAVRRARPRLEEGPLREDTNQVAAAQMRETACVAEPEGIQTAMQEAPVSTEWSPIHLDLKSATSQEEEPIAPAVDLHIQAAPIEDRAIALVVDCALVLFAFVFFVFAAAASNASLPTGKTAMVAGGLVILGIYLLYQYLFFKFADGTPGMRYARIALCTFEDEVPTRKQMRRRIPYLLFSAAPLGLGYLWAWFDANRLSWHDRLTRTYQRSCE